MVVAFRAIFRTVRVKQHFSSPETSPFIPAGDQKFLYCMWHDALVLPVFAAHQPSTTALVGQHNDGSYVSNILAAVGIPSVRGSSSKGGARAVKQLIEATNDRHVVMTSDGPRGPEHQVKDGLAYIASRSGKPVLPATFGCSRQWYFQGSWTDLIIPSLFAKLHIIIGEPIFIPAKAKRGELAEYTARIQAEMDRLDKLAKQLALGQIDEMPEFPSQVVPSKSPERKAA
jgi:hypothetical protein